MQSRDITGSLPKQTYSPKTLVVRVKLADHMTQKEKKEGKAHKSKNIPSFLTTLSL